MAQNLLINSLINLGLPDKSPDGVKDPEVRAVYEFIIRAFNSFQRGIEQFSGITTKDITQWSQLQPSDTLFRQNLGRFYVLANEAIAAGAFVNLLNVAGVCKVQNANSIGKPAHGYCNVAGGVLAGNFTEIILGQGMLAIGGVNPGDALYLSNNPGLAALAHDVADGRIAQYLGVGVAPGVAYIDITLGQYDDRGLKVNVVAPTAPNRTISITIGGTTYFIAAKTTNN